MNRLFVAKKPINISSNHFLSSLKRRYNQKKAGFTGTLDPFASGVLVVGFGVHTKLFRFLKKTPKKYQATLWLGASSKSLDNENITNITTVDEINQVLIKNAVDELQTTLTYRPPIFSAKNINGQRAYQLARDNQEIKLKKITSTIYETKFIAYCHPFITFEATVSEGTYIRSLAQILAQKLGVKNAVLSSLMRLSEGKFIYEHEKALDIKKYLAITLNKYLGETENIFYGRALKIKDLKIKDDGYYWIDNNDTITIIKITNSQIKYELNKVALC